MEKQAISNRVLRAPLAFALGAVMLGGCAGSGSQVGSDGSASTSDSEDVAFVEESGVFPDDGLSSWVTYANQVSVVEIVSERQFADGEPLGGVGSVGRYVTARVEETLWSRDGNPQSEIEFITHGWITEEGRLIPVQSSSGERLEVGQRYVLPLVDTGDEWGVLTSSSVLPLDGPAVQDGASFKARDSSAESFKGTSLADLKKDLETAKPDPLLEEVDPDLSPIQKALKIAELRYSKGRNPGD